MTTPREQAIVSIGVIPLVRAIVPVWIDAEKGRACIPTWDHMDFCA